MNINLISSTMNSLLKTRWLLIAFFVLGSGYCFSQDIYTVVRNGDVSMTREILAKDPGLLNQRNQDLLTPLNLAAEPFPGLRLF
jgi:hypothetical protein